MLKSTVAKVYLLNTSDKIFGVEHLLSPRKKGKIYNHTLLFQFYNNENKQQQH